MPDKKQFTPAGWATELGTRFYRAAMKKAGIDLDATITQDKFERAVEKWAKTPVPAKVLPKASEITASMIAKGEARPYEGEPKEEPKLKAEPKPKVEPIKVGED